MARLSACASGEWLGTPRASRASLRICSARTASHAAARTALALRCRARRAALVMGTVGAFPSVPGWRWIDGDGDGYGWQARAVPGSALQASCSLVPGVLTVPT